METISDSTPRNGLSVNIFNLEENTNGISVCNSPAFESAATAYASRVLHQKSPPEACFDSSVASYVVSTLQSTLSVTSTPDYANLSVQDLDEYQPLIELLEEHCHMETPVAHNVLQSIAKALRTGVFDPHEDSALQNVLGSSPAEFGGLINLGGSHVGRRMGRYRSKSMGCYEDMDAMARLGNLLKNPHSSMYNSSLFSGVTNNEDGEEPSTIEEEPSFFLEEDELPITPQKAEIKIHPTQLNSEETSVTEDSSTAEMTPLKPDRLIPVDLLGADDFMSPADKMYSKASHEFTVLPTPPDCKNYALTSIPNISASMIKGKKKPKVKSKDLAAALFCSRPRSNSLQQDKTPKLQPMSPSLVSYGSTPGSTSFQNQVNSTVQMLMAMNFDICEDAAYEAALVSNADVNVAQCVIDGAVAAPAVCRHMLNGGCYRSDCQFSHDVDGHTCSFWLKGRCGKGIACRFMHGFSKSLLDGVKAKYLPGSDESCATVSGTKSIPIKTANLVQHNMKTSFSLPNVRGSGTLFPSPDSKVFSFEQRYSLSKPSPTTSISTSPTHTPEKKHGLLSISLEMRDDSAPVSSTDVEKPVTESKTFSFARIASSGYDKKSSYFDSSSSPSHNAEHGNKNHRTVRIPHNLWNACYNRPASAFHIQDPIERYKEVSSFVKREDIIDMHFQSLKSFPIVLSKILPEKLRNHSEVWIVTGTGHHVTRNTHQKSGGILENSLIDWLTSNHYKFLRGKDKNGFRGAVLVKR